MNHLIDEVEFDPWTPKYEQEKYKTLIKDKLGFEGDVYFSPLYKELGENQKRILKISENKRK